MQDQVLLKATEANLKQALFVLFKEMLYILEQTYQTIPRPLSLLVFTIIIKHRAV